MKPFNLKELKVTKVDPDREVFEGTQTAHISHKEIYYSIMYRDALGAFTMNRNGAWFFEGKSSHIDIAIHYAKALILAGDNMPTVFEFDFS